MNFFKNLSITGWIITIVTTLLILLLAVSIMSATSLNKTGQELKGIAELDLPATRKLSDITKLQLEQAIHFERAFRYGENMQTENKAKARFDETVSGFHLRTSKIGKTIADLGQFLVKQTKSAHNQNETKEITRAINALKEIEQAHKDYTDQADQVFSLLAANKIRDAEVPGKKLNIKENQLDKKVEDLLTEFEKFTQTAATTAEQHEQTALKTLTVLSILALLAGVILSYLAIRYAVNPLLAERLENLRAAEKESKTLNASIIGLLQTVAALSQRDLTVKATVTEDVTGSVADALNLMTSEMTKVLKQVNLVSDDVSTTSVAVKEQSDLVTQLAAEERRVVDSASQTLQQTIESMREVAKLTETSNQTAEQAIEATDKAFTTVNETVQGINDTRDTIRETEKRIKRLGERSQEISSAVNLINTIAERTHILALNASMHAASAGEAGRGFAVVADEVQRLAESSREATAQIATLVKNIQVETSETVNTMNETITQIVAGSRLAQQAGEEMQLTQENTTELVAKMHEIADRITAQAAEIEKMENSMIQIRKTTVETSNQLGEQSKATSNLVEFSSTLVSAVNVFKLPEQADAK